MRNVVCLQSLKCQCRGEHKKHGSITALIKHYKAHLGFCKIKIFRLYVAKNCDISAFLPAYRQHQHLP